MKKFKFKLESVHSVREMRKEKEQLIFAQLQNEANKVFEEIEQIEQTRLKAITNYLDKLNRGELTNPVEMEMNLRHITELDRRQREMRAVLEEKKLACSEQGKKVAEANQQVKITDRLRENQQNQHKLEFEREQQHSLDELISTNFARNMTEQ
jgi:flagellar export protein FliJ